MSSRTCRSSRSTICSRSVATTPQLRPPPATTRTSRSSPFRRRWTTTCATPNTASASPPPSPAPIDAIQRQRTTVGSHERIGIFRIFGRDAGYTALYTAYVTNIRCVIPEHRFDLDRLIELLVKDKRSNPVELLARPPLRGRRVGRLRDRPIRRSRCLRPPQKDERRRRVLQRSEAPRRRRDHRQRSDLRPALRRSRLHR